MACYAAVVSLKQTLHHLKHSCNNNNPSPQIIDFAYEEVKSVETFLQELDVVRGFIKRSGSDEIGSSEWAELNSVSAILKLGKSSETRGFRVDVKFMNGLDVLMRQAVCQLEDALETHLVNHHDSAIISELDLQDLKRDVDWFSIRMREWKGMYYIEVEKEEEEEEEEEEEDYDDFDSPTTDFDSPTKMVGFSDVFRQMKDEFLRDTECVKIGSLVGMAGLGKTTLAREFFEDPAVMNRFHKRVWVTVGPKYNVTDIVRSILDQVNPEFCGMQVKRRRFTLLSACKLGKSEMPYCVG
ncbi:hypothetical protein CASFOL_004644 [Castilleja foliolosa]|uniref:NB-ARC domain-containing protein n=1 Tax=Castilleja foliolosa TaxID=1961234 RepID=A0ABD3EBH9_9LAMI